MMSRTMKTLQASACLALAVGMAGLAIALTARPARGQSAPFHLEEATIADLHRAIQAGQTTCAAVVQAYVARARAYNGVCTALVTRDGAPIPPAKGTVRAGSPIVFPTKT